MRASVHAQTNSLMTDVLYARLISSSFAVFEINNAVESFPSNLVAGAFGFQLHDFFEAADGVRDRVEVTG